MIQSTEIGVRLQQKPLMFHIESNMYCCILVATIAPNLQRIYRMTRMLSAATMFDHDTHDERW